MILDVPPDGQGRRRDQDDLHGDGRTAVPEPFPVEPDIDSVGPEEDLCHPVQGQSHAEDAEEVVLPIGGGLPVVDEPAPVFIADAMHPGVHHDHLPKAHQLHQENDLKDQCAEQHLPPPLALVP